MPYPNEHAARVRDPASFEKNSFRTKELKAGLRIILGKLKGETNMTVQAYRFSTDQFTTEEAKKWLEDHKIKYIKFEPAQAEFKNGGSMSNELKHVGVLGMRWGVHRASKRIRNQSEDHKLAASIKKKHISQMSNDEIKTLSKRLELENRYKNLNPSKVTKGKKHVDNVFSAIGKLSAVAASTVALVAIGKPIFIKAVTYAKKVRGNR